MPWDPNPDQFGGWFTICLMIVCTLGLVATVLL